MTQSKPAVQTLPESETCLLQKQKCAEGLLKFCESPVPFSQGTEVDTVINITEPLKRCQQEVSDTLQSLPQHPMAHQLHLNSNL